MYQNDFYLGSVSRPMEPRQRYVYKTNMNRSARIIRPAEPIYYSKNNMIAIEERRHSLDVDNVPVYEKLRPGVYTSTAPREIHDGVARVVSSTSYADGDYLDDVCEDEEQSEVIDTNKVVRNLTAVGRFLEMLQSLPLPRLSLTTSCICFIIAIFISPRPCAQNIIFPAFRLSFGTLYPAYASYKAVRTKNVKEYVRHIPLFSSYWQASILTHDSLFSGQVDDVLDCVRIFHMHGNFYRHLPVVVPILL